MALRKTGADIVANAVAQENNNGVTPAENMGANATTTASKTAGGNKPFENFKKTGTAIREQMSEEEKQMEGCKSHLVKFEIALGNPQKPMKRVQNQQKLNSYEVVGYRFKALGDVEVPTCKPTANTIKNPMDCEAPTWRTVHAGETFDLTSCELGHMISRIEFSGIFNGEGDEVILHVTTTKSRAGAPLSVLKRRGAPLKDNMLLIADKEEIDGKKKFTVKDEFADKFGYLFVRRTSNNGHGSTSRVGESPKDLSAALRLYFDKQKAN